MSIQADYTVYIYKLDVERQIQYKLWLELNLKLHIYDFFSYVPLATHLGHCLRIRGWISLGWCCFFIFYMHDQYLVKTRDGRQVD